MSMSTWEVKQWEKYYDALGFCLNCGEWFFYPCKATCDRDDERLNERVICGDCLRPTCTGCGR